MLKVIVKFLPEYCYQRDFFSYKDGSKSGKHLLFVDSLGGRILEQNEYDDNDILHYKRINKYDQKGNLIEQTNCYLRNDSNCYRTVFTFDKYYNVIRKKTYYMDTIFSSYKYYRYDNFQNLIFECDSSLKYVGTTDSLALSYSSRAYYNLYDIDNNLIENGEIISSHNEKSDTYKYDHFGNLIEKIRYWDGKPQEYYKRTFQYY